MNTKIKVVINGSSIFATAGSTLSEIISGERPCGGHGKCGKCRVLVRGNLSEPSEAELQVLSQDEIAGGIRLACLTQALGDCEVEYFKDAKVSQIVTDGVLPEFELSPSFSNYGVAIDIGTTTLAARLYDVKGNMLAEVSRLNPQSKWGADVISRIEAALDGKEKELAKAIRQELDGILSELGDIAKISSKEFDGVVITGNTVMLSMLTEESVEPFSHAPFDARRLFGETLTAEQLDLSTLAPNTTVYLPPCISAFVGADITCAILATALYKADTAMLADIGTNGELAIWHNGKLTVCSTAAGPAFEGVGITMGMRGTLGAIDQVRISDGALFTHVIGNATPIGICGSGLIDAVACMLDQEIIDESGYIEQDPFVIKEPVFLAQKDIRMLQLAKSAICAGLLTLIDSQNLKIEDIPTLYIAGGFGNYLNKESAAKIGLLPRELANVSVTVGNAALSGASMLLLNSVVQTECDALAQKACVLELSSNKNFSYRYMAGMVFD